MKPDARVHRAYGGDPNGPLRHDPAGPLVNADHQQGGRHPLKSRNQPVRLLAHPIQRGQQQRIAREVPEMFTPKVQHLSLFGQAAGHRQVAAAVGLRNPPGTNLGDQEQHQQPQPQARSLVDRRQPALQLGAKPADSRARKRVGAHESSVIRGAAAGSIRERRRILPVSGETATPVSRPSIKAP